MYHKATQFRFGPLQIFEEHVPLYINTLMYLPSALAFALAFALALALAFALGFAWPSELW